MSPMVRTYTLPVAMVVGVCFRDFFASLNFLTPYLIFLMLFITFSRVSVKDLKIQPLNLVLLAFQLLVGVALYLILRGFSEVVAQGALICVFAPAAMASVVIGGMLGANVLTMTTFSLLSNMAVAIFSPVLFALVGAGTDMPFMDAFWHVFQRVVLLLIFPFVAAWFSEKYLHRLHKFMCSHQSLSFYFWGLSLTILMGSTSKFVLAQPSNNYSVEIVLAVVALLICLAQFGFGWMAGRKYGDVVAGGQSLGQKNTVLAIWLTQTYLNPLASVAPAAYIICQNVVNSIQLMRKK